MLLLSRACWTVSCQRWVTKITLTLLAYHGPSGAASSSLVSLRVPWYTWGLIGCVKFSVCVCAGLYLSRWYCECYRVGWEYVCVCVCVCLSWSVTQCLCTCIITAEGAEQVVLKIPLMDYYYLSARLFSLTPFCTSQLRTPSYCRWMRSRGHQISLSSLLFYTGRESIAHKGWDKRCAVVVNEKEYSTITSSNRERASLWLHHFVCPLLI